MVEVVFEGSNLHHGLVRLLGQDYGIFIVAVKLNLIELLVLVDCLKLISLKQRFDVGFLFSSFIWF